MVAPMAAGNLANMFVHREKHLGGAVNNLLNGSVSDGNIQHRGTQLFDIVSAHAFGTVQLSNKRRKTITKLKYQKMSVLSTCK